MTDAKREREIFERAIEVDPDTVDAFLRDACGGDRTLERRVRRLLDAHHRSPATATTAGRAPQLTDDPEVIGPYRLLERIGEGGMGSVYVAEQSRPVRRRVALKVIKAGMDTKEVIARFHSERQALALMNHANIARMFDSGATDQGRPYFVMEHVPGVPLIEYCDRKRLTLRERLELFAEICMAVQHAHQKSVVHRDLKPSNILVMEEDGQAVPKVIDFGIAKALHQPLSEVTLHTRQGGFIGTPEYTSPEQAELTGLDVDTRADVYALGAVLYELLVGTRPFDFSDPALSLAQIQRTICETDPPRPSRRVDDEVQRAERWADARHTDAATLARSLRGDLDWIVMRALEKDRQRRYSSASELAADIRRHLANEPVTAGSPGAPYRLRKFVRRHRIVVCTTAAGVLILVGFAATMALQAKRIAIERDLAEQARADLQVVAAFQAEMISEVDPEQMGVWLAKDLRESIAETTRARGLSEREVADFLESYDASMREVNLTNTALEVIEREVLGRAVATLEERFGDQPLVDARLRETIGETYRKLGRFGAAEPQLERSLEIRRRVLGDDHRDTLASVFKLADLYRNQSRYDEAEPLYLEAYENMKRALGEEHPDTLSALGNLAILYEDQGRYDEAEPLFLETLEARRRVLGNNHVDTLNSMSTLAGVYWSQGRYAEAEPLYVEALEIRKRVGDDDIRTFTSMNNLAGLYWDEGRYDEAEPLMLESVEGCKRVLGDDHPRTLVAMNNLANLYRSQGRPDEAEPLLLEALDAQRRVLGNDHPSTLISLGNLGELYVLEKRPELAVQLLAEAVAGVSRALPREHVLTGATIRKHGVALTALGRYEDAEAQLLEAHEILTAAVGADHPQTQKVISNLVELYEVWNKPAKTADWRARLPAEE